MKKTSETVAVSHADAPISAITFAVWARDERKRTARLRTWFISGLAVILLVMSLIIGFNLYNIRHDEYTNASFQTQITNKLLANQATIGTNQQASHDATVKACISTREALTDISEVDDFRAKNDKYISDNGLSIGVRQGFAERSKVEASIAKKLKDDLTSLCQFSYTPLIGHKSTSPQYPPPPKYQPVQPVKTKESN